MFAVHYQVVMSITVEKTLIEVEQVEQSALDQAEQLVTIHSVLQTLEVKPAGQKVAQHFVPEMVKPTALVAMKVYS